jgi:hypothetical protein
MPFYVWTCFECPNSSHTSWQSISAPRIAPLCECGRPMERDWHAEHRGHVPVSTFPYFTSHITGHPLEVKSESHLQQLCKQHNVRHRPDAAFIENDSGQGLPGSWY